LSCEGTRLKCSAIDQVLALDDGAGEPGLQLEQLGGQRVDGLAVDGKHRLPTRRAATPRPMLGHQQCRTWGREERIEHLPGAPADDGQCDARQRGQLLHELPQLFGGVRLVRRRREGQQGAVEVGQDPERCVTSQREPLLAFEIDPRVHGLRITVPWLGRTARE
jgi:hypothetical protein